MHKAEYTKLFTVEDNHWWFVSKRNFINEYLKRIPLPKKAKIVDLGCGTGGNIALLSKYGNVTAVDNSPYALEALKKRHVKGFIKANINYVGKKLSKNTYDLITLFDVLYHKQINDQKVLNQVFQLVKKGGYVLITDCAVPLLYSQHDRLNQARQRYWKSELEDKCKLAGFTIQKSSYMFLTTFIFFALHRLLQKNSTQSADYPSFGLLNQILIAVIKIETKITSYLPMPIGSSIIVLAKKV